MKLQPCTVVIKQQLIQENTLRNPMKPQRTLWNPKDHTANVLDAKIATKSSVTFPAALRMPFLQLIVAANY